MKKFISFILTSLLALAFVGCANPIGEAIGSGLDKFACSPEKTQYKGGCYYKIGNENMTMRNAANTEPYKDMWLRRALNSYQRACDLGHRNACYESGLIYRDKKIVQDETKARANLTKACQAGYLDGCNETLPLLKSDTEKKALFVAACSSSKDNQICDEYYARYAVSENEAYLKKKCEEYYFYGYDYCNKVGKFYESKNNLSLAKTYYKKACDKGRSCADLRRIDPSYAAQEDAKAEREMAEKLGVSRKCKNNNDRSDCYTTESFSIAGDWFNAVAYKNNVIVKLQKFNGFSCNVIRNDAEWLMMTCSDTKPYSLKLNKLTGQVTKISTSLDGLW